MYKYLLWDVDGTVLDFLAAEKYAIRKLFEKYKIGECTDEMLKLYSVINEKYWQMLERKELSKAEILVGRFREFVELINVDTSLSEAFNKDYQLAVGDCIVFINGAKEILLSEKGRYVLAAVTNGTRVAQEKKLKLSGLDKIFDDIFISEIVDFEKPDKAFFDFVLKKLEVTDKKEVLIIGDSLTSDILGGNNAGIDTCWYNPSHKKNQLDIPVTYETDNLLKIEKILDL